MKFVFIDEILELIPGERVSAIARIARNEPYFADHFPGFPVVPGVLLTEMMGQAAAKCLDLDLETRGKAVLAKITAATFRGWVRPGETVSLDAEIRSDRDRFATADCRAEVDGKRVAAAELLFTFVPLQDFPPDCRATILGEFSGGTPKGEIL